MIKMNGIKARRIKARRIIVKIGTSSLTGRDGFLDLSVIKSLAAQIAEIKNSGMQVLLVTSGAIGAGMKELGIKSRPKHVVMRQVCAAIGQAILISKYQSLFGKRGIKVAQILLTRDALSNSRNCINLRNSISKLLDLGVIPIINENDSISIDEIVPSFGDNDILSAMLSLKTGADLLAILTDVDGLLDKEGNLVIRVAEINEGIKSLCTDKGNGTGGMISKLEAADLLLKEGIPTIIGNARYSLIDLIENEKIRTLICK